MIKLEDFSMLSLQYKKGKRTERFTGDAKDPITFGSNHYYCGNILALCISSSSWETATRYQYQTWKYPGLLTHRILHFIECSINYPAAIFKIKTSSHIKSMSTCL